MEYFIGVDMAKESDSDFLSVAIMELKGGKTEFVDNLVSKDSDKIREFILKYDPEYFNKENMVKRIKNQIKFELNTYELKQLNPGNGFSVNLSHVDSVLEGMKSVFKN